MKRVLISQREVRLPERGETRDALDQRLVAFVAAAGGVPIPVPNSLADAGILEAWLAALRSEAIVLSGGDDIGTCPARDHTERHLLDLASNHAVPVLGICRGMQMMGVWGGAALLPVDGHVAQDHPVNGPVTAMVNSYHQYALDKLPKHFHALAHSPDGTLEAMAHDTLPWEGWMWHPERSTNWTLNLERFIRLLATEAPPRNAA
jgi:N5-(cytidine 5'-diphosphoramidyl)-L-glutamine hydrolase